MKAISNSIQRGNTVIHCVAGFSRSPIMAAAWMCRSERLDFDTALQEIAEMRPGTDPLPVLVRSVRERLRAK